MTGLASAAIADLSLEYTNSFIPFQSLHLVKSNTSASSEPFVIALLVSIAAKVRLIASRPIQYPAPSSPSKYPQPPALTTFPVSVI